MSAWIVPSNFSQSVTNGVAATGAITTAQGGTGSTSASTGSGGVVLANTPTLVTPVLGTPASINLTNATVVPMAQASGTLGVSNGGTGQTTANAAFNALSPMTTGGDIIYGGASGVATRLANGTSGQVLTSSGGTAAPTWTSAGISYAAHAMSGTGVVLTTSSPTDQFWTSGSTSTLVTLPTLAGGDVGLTFHIVNAGTGGTLTVNAPSPFVTILTLPIGTGVYLTGIASGGSTASWVVTQ